MTRSPRRAAPARPLRRPLLGIVLGGLLLAGAATGQERIAAVLERRLAANPRDAEALEQLGVERLRRGDHARALIQLHKAIAVSPRRGTAYFYLGLVYYERGLLFREIEAYQKSILHLPDFMPARLNLAHAYLAAGRVPDAIEQYRWVERQDPGNLTVLHNLGILFADLNRSQDARTYLERYLSLAPAGAPGRVRAAEILARATEESDR
ncbi:MAG: tetratricopeptide repeat protein [Gemmatimonadota bacterium]